MLKKITNDDIPKLRELLMLEINDVAYGGTDKANYFFDDITHCLEVKGGYITARSKGSIVYNIGIWSNGKYNTSLINHFIKVLRFCQVKFKEVYFWCYQDNKRLSDLMCKKFNCKLIRETNKVKYYKYTREEVNNDD